MRLVLAVLVCLAAALAGGGARAQAGGGLGLVRDTLALAPGQTGAGLPAGIVPSTLVVEALRADAFERLAPDAYTFDPRLNLLRLAAPADSVVVLRVGYRTLPRLAPVAVRVPRLDSLRAAESAADSLGRPLPGASAFEAAQTSLRTTGSVTRGVVAGSQRDVSLTSGLRLNVAGEVAPGVTLRAALSDENTPVLPEGTTRQLADLDRVFVEVDARRARARLGDVAVSLPGTAFAPLARTVQGALAEADLPARGALAGGRVLGLGSATRGQYRSQDVRAVDGVQGPYRITGALGEAFVVVVPGSERVVLDGRPLVRGADYTVDYGTGEITFTPARLITAERRITVDFEYTAGGFTRSLVGGLAEAGLLPRADGTPRARLGVRLFREADGAASALNLGLSEADLDAIAAAGAGEAVVPGEERVAFDAASPFVLYVRRDTLVAGVPARVFVPATAADAAAGREVFRVRFSRVAPGAGDYRRAGQVRNGILYEYVGPGHGDAVAFRRLPRPAARTLASAAAAAEPLPGLELFGEWAGSADDVNTLARGASREGAAWEGGLRLRPARLGPGRLDGQLRVRRRADAFRTLDRVRDVEFERRWNLSRAGAGVVLDTLGEALADVGLHWAAAGQAEGRLEAGRLRIGGLTATQARAEARVGTPGEGTPWGLPAVEALASLARTEGAGPLAETLGTGTFARQRLAAARPFGAWTPSAAVEAERREQAGGRVPGEGGEPGFGGAGGNRLGPSYGFVALRSGLAFAAERTRADVGVEWRTEREPLGPVGASGPLVPSARALSAEAEATVRGPAALSADGRVALRRTRYVDAFRQLGREDGEAVAARLTARASPLGGASTVQIGYEALTERAPVLQETYVLVGPDLGEFVWRDGGGEPRPGEPDGIAQLDEFFPETTPLEGTYLRVFIPGDALLPSVGVNAALRATLRPGRLVAADAPVAAVLRALALRGSLDVREQTREPDVLGVLVLRPGALQQAAGGGPDSTATVSGRFRAEGEVALFPESVRRGGRLAVDHLTSTQRLAAGLERRLVQSVRAEARAALSPQIGARLEAAAERRRTLADAFATRTFDLRGLSAEPRLTWTPSARVAASAGAFAARRRDALALEVSGADVLRVPADARLTLRGRGTLAARAELSVVRLVGVAAGGLALFELTEGRGAGASALWGLTAEIGLTERLRATVAYDARAPASARLVQTVRVQVSAVF